MELPKPYQTPSPYSSFRDCSKSADHSARPPARSDGREATIITLPGAQPTATFVAAGAAAELTSSSFLVVCACIEIFEEVQCGVDLCYPALDFVALSP